MSSLRALRFALGLVLLARRKGDSWHVRLGQLYLAVMVAVAVAVPVMIVYDISGRPGPFHVLAILSIFTTALG